MNKRRKNYLPALMTMVILWGLLGALIIWVEPKLIKDILIDGLYLPFFMLFFPAIFLTLAVILGDSRRGLLISLGLTGALILRVYRLENWLNLILIAGIVVAVDRYFKE
ncbi:MAG: hypothetical protein V1810_01130 [Candidatus Beckwithbacteria bacterium]